MELSNSPLLFSGLQVLFFILLLCFTIHTLFLSYHWFTYGSNRRVSLIALSIYLAGGAILFLTFSIGLQSLSMV